MYAHQLFSVDILPASLSDTKHSLIQSLQNRYAQGQQEQVTFYAQQNASSSLRKIARKGILVKHENAKANVLICHGFMCDKRDIGFLRSLFPDCNTLAFDFRAHGEATEGQCCTLGRDEAYDVIAAGELFKSRPDLKDLPLIVYGFSMGAAASIEAQAKEPALFDAMILDCPFDSSENVIKRGIDSMKFSLLGYQVDIPGRTLLQKYAFHPYVQSIVRGMLKAVASMDTKNINLFVYPISPAESIKKVTVPCLFIHCKNDEKVSVNEVKNIYNNAASAYKMLWITNGRKHYDSFFYEPENYAKYVNDFIADVATKQVHTNPLHILIEDPDEQPACIKKEVKI